MKPQDQLDGLGDRGVVAKLLKELAAATTKPARLRAIGVELGEERLVHQGAWAPVAPFAVPHLIACLEDAAFADHPSVLLCLAHVAAGDPTSHWTGHVKGASSLATLTLQHPASLAVQQGRAAIEALLDARKPLTRALTAFVLALLPPSPACIAARLVVEQDALARLALYVCVASWSRAFDAPMALPSAVEKDELARLGQALAFAEIDAPSSERITVLQQAVTAPPPGLDARKNVPLRAHRMALATLQRRAPKAAQSLALEALKSGAITPALAAQMVLGDQRAGRAWAPLPPFASHAPEVQKTLIAIAKKANAEEVVWLDEEDARLLGLPMRVTELRSYVGLTKTLLEAPLEGLPGYTWLRRFALGEVTREALVHAVLNAPAPAQIAAFAVGIGSWAYDLDVVSDAPWATFTELASEILSRHPEARAHALTLKVVHPFAVLAILDAAARAGEPIPKRWDAQMHALDRPGPPMDAMVERVLLSLPAARRDALVLAFDLPEDIQEEAYAGRRLLAPHAGGWRYLHLASDKDAAAARAVSAIALWQAPPEGCVLPDVAGCLAALREPARAKLKGLKMTKVGGAVLKEALR